MEPRFDSVLVAHSIRGALHFARDSPRSSIIPSTPFLNSLLLNHHLPLSDRGYNRHGARTGLVPRLGGQESKDSSVNLLTTESSSHCVD